MRTAHLPFLLALTACDTGGDDTSPPAETGDDTGQTTSLCPEPVPPPCLDQMIMDLSLHDDLVSDGAVTNTLDGTDFLTVVDATAGGFGNDSEHPWVYVRFDAAGATRVDIDDETALGSQAWHLALRRSQLRLNGGDGGPSCVGTDARSTSEYAEITAIPADAEYLLEDFYSPTCDLVLEENGLYPDYVLGGWWDYGACVETTMLPYVIQLDDGQVLKLVVEAYYETGQEDCNDDGSPGTNSGVITLRWSFLL
jgi:hypothetical protein